MSRPPALPRIATPSPIGDAAPVAQAVAAVLLVRRPDDLPGAVRATNAFLARRAALGAACDDVLAIVVGGSIVPHLSDLAPDERAPLEPHVALRCSMSLSGAWNLAWVELGDAARCPRPSDRRRRLLDAVVSPSAGATDRLIVLPVLSPEETDDVSAILQPLMARYPDVWLAPEVFVHAPSRGGLVRHADRTTAEPTRWMPRTSPRRALHAERRAAGRG